MRQHQIDARFSVPQIARMSSTTDCTDNTDGSVAADGFRGARTASLHSVSSVVSTFRHRRRAWIAGRFFNAVLLMLTVVVAIRCAESPASAAGKPNIVIIISDDQAWGDYGFMGHPAIQTPHLDKLAAESLTFTRGYVPASLCCPSLASIITGRFPHQHRVTSNDPLVPAGMKPAEFQKSPGFQAGRDIMNSYMDAMPTLPRLLSGNGYLSLQTGKWWQGSYTHGGFTHGMTKGGRHGDEGLDIGRKTMQPIYDFIGEAKKEGKPFFVWYAPMMPHDPHTPPARILEKYKGRTPSEHVAKYWAMVEWFDETCGELLGFLDREKAAENTIVVYVTDNGWIQNPDAPKYAPKSKQSQYDGGLRTPIMVRWPAKIRPAKGDAVVSSLDILPTLLDATGIKRPEGLPGVSLMDSAALGARDAVFGECFTHNSKDLGNPSASLRWRWAIMGGWKLIVPASQNEPTAQTELYNLKADPTEEKNLADAEKERVEKMRVKLDAWWKG
jgi:arylsulfatase A-like enzyme